MIDWTKVINFTEREIKPNTILHGDIEIAMRRVAEAIREKEGEKVG